METFIAALGLLAVAALIAIAGSLYGLSVVAGKLLTDDAASDADLADHVGHSDRMAALLLSILDQARQTDTTGRAIAARLETIAERQMLALASLDSIDSRVASALLDFRDERTVAADLAPAAKPPRKHRATKIKLAASDAPQAPQAPQAPEVDPNQGALSLTE